MEYAVKNTATFVPNETSMASTAPMRSAALQRRQSRRKSRSGLMDLIRPKGYWRMRGGQRKVTIGHPYAIRARLCHGGQVERHKDGGIERGKTNREGEEININLADDPIEAFQSTSEHRIYSSL